MGNKMKEPDSFYVFSELNALVDCLGRRRLIKSLTKEQLVFRDSDDLARQEGILAHKQAEYLFNGGELLPDVTPEMLEHVTTYVNYAKDVAKGAHLHIEAEVHFDVELGSPSRLIRISGRPDIFFLDKQNRTLHVFELKYGHKYVSEKENLQFASAAIAAAKLFGIDTLSQLSNYVFHLYQPRCYSADPIRKAEHSPEALSALLSKILSSIRAIEFDVQLPFTVSDNCRSCPGASACAMFNRVSLESLDNAYMSNIPVTISDEKIGHYLFALEQAEKIIKNRAENLRAEIMKRIRNGVRNDVYVMQQGYGHKKWSKTPEELKTISEFTNINFFEEKLMTPNQVATKYPGAANVIESLSYRPLGEQKLVVDKRDYTKLLQKED